MKKVLTLVILFGISGCVEVKDYQQVVKYPAPDNLVGNWQTIGPETSLLSPDARASLTIEPDGQTLDCREWQRVITVPGKLTQLEGKKGWVNVTEQRDIYDLKLSDGYLIYDGMNLKRVSQTADACGSNSLSKK